MMRIAVAASAAALWPVAASAADQLGLSNDGVSWASALPAPLFDSSFRWVPGDRETASFWVRNQSRTRAALDIAVLGSSVDSLMETGDLKVDVRAGSGPWVSTSEVGRQALVSSLRVNAGETQQVTVAVVFDAASTNQSQVKKLDLKFDVRLTQDTSKNGSGPDDRDASENGPHGDDHLPGTGGLPWWVLPSGAVLTGGGAALVARARRRTSHA